MCVYSYLRLQSSENYNFISYNFFPHVLYAIYVIYLYDKFQEQLGYIVFSGIRKVNGANGIRIIVQSSKHPSFVEDRIESFLENYLVKTYNYKKMKQPFFKAIFVLLYSKLWRKCRWMNLNDIKRL